MESEGEGQVLASPLFSLADSNTLMLICTGYSKVIYILITGYLNIVILITGVLFVCVCFESSFVFRTVFKEKEMGSGQELRAEQDPACRDQNEK